MTFAQLAGLPGVTINIPFQINTPNYGVLSSAINLTVAEAQAYTNTDFNNHKQALKDAWIASRDNPPVSIPLTPEDEDNIANDMENRLEQFLRSLSPAKRHALKDALQARFSNFGE